MEYMKLDTQQEERKSIRIFLESNSAMTETVMVNPTGMLIDKR